MQPLRPVTAATGIHRPEPVRPTTAPAPQIEQREKAVDSPLFASPGTGKERWGKLGGDFSGMGQAQLVRMVVRAEKENRGDSAEFCGALKVPVTDYILSRCPTP